MRKQRNRIKRNTVPKFRAAKPKSPNQKRYLASIADNTVVICQGHAGTGKTLLALSSALQLFYDKSSPFERIIIVRPYMKSNTGEELGALPGKLEAKVGPFVESIMDNLRQLCSREEASRLIHSQDIEFTVLSMCRGRSFNNCIVIVEEAQNVPKQGNGMKMLLTRVGRCSKMIIAGDSDQADIEDSALGDVADRIAGINDVGIIEMYENHDIQRSRVVRDILERFENDGEPYHNRVRFVETGVRPGHNGHYHL